MKKTLTRFIGIFTAALILALSFGTDAQAYSEREGFWDFEQTVIKMDAGSTRDIRVISNYDYTYYVGPHTSAGTYMECTFKAGTEVVRLHIGADETVKNVFFHFYADDVRLGVVDVHDCIEVYVQNINQTAAQGGQEYRAAVENLKKYAGNTNEFNAYYYYVNYADLQNAFGPDGDKLLEHYNVFGKNEKRIATRFK
ncbi:MAG: hypothetical protein IJS12_00300 [Lachnospiraceae bacterium]|nr:hypothetical protein [Lachnospiraceae bacterium]